MLRKIAQKMEMSLNDLKDALAYNYGINQDSFMAGLDCFETLPEGVRTQLLAEAGLTEEDLQEEQLEDETTDGDEDEDEESEDEDQEKTGNGNQVSETDKEQETPPVVTPATNGVIGKVAAVFNNKAK